MLFCMLWFYTDFIVHLYYLISNDYTKMSNLVTHSYQNHLMSRLSDFLNLSKTGIHSSTTCIYIVTHFFHRSFGLLGPNMNLMSRWPVEHIHRTIYASHVWTYSSNKRKPSIQTAIVTWVKSRLMIVCSPSKIPLLGSISLMWGIRVPSETLTDRLVALVSNTFDDWCVNVGFRYH